MCKLSGAGLAHQLCSLTGVLKRIWGISSTNWINCQEKTIQYIHLGNSIERNRLIDSAEPHLNKSNLCVCVQYITL